MADEVYADLAPIAEGDGTRGYALRALVRAIGSMFAQPEEAIRALGDGRDSWERVWDADLTPAWLLPFAGQAVGVMVDTSLSEVAQRAQIKEESGWKRGRVASMVAAIQSTLGHANFVPNPSFEYDPPNGLPKLWSVAANAFIVAGAEYSVLPEAAYRGTNRMQIHSTGVAKQGASIACPGTFYKGVPYSLSFRVLSGAGGQIQGVLGSLATGGSAAGAALTIPSNVWTYYTVTWTPTANSTDVVCAIRNPNATTETYAADAVQVEYGLAPGEYFDGDQPGARWIGLQGQSASYQTTGERRVRVVERNGSAYSMLMVTSPGQTPNPALTNTVAQQAKPGGIILTVEQSDLPLIDEGTKTIDASTGVIDTAKLSDVT